MKSLLTAILLLVAVASHANEKSTFYCLRDDNGDDWNITIDLSEPSANLWDNDSHSEFVYIGMTDGTYNFSEKGGHSEGMIDFTPSADGLTGSALLYDEHQGPEDGLTFTCTKQ